MAKTVGDFDERLERIKMVGDYVLANWTSTRETANFFSENLFKISNYTVSEYCKEYMKYYPQRKEEMQKIISGKTPQTIDDETVYERVMYNTYLTINKGLTVKEISDITGADYWVVYRDLTSRLQKLDIDSYYKVKEIFEQRSNENLKL